MDSPTTPMQDPAARPTQVTDRTEKPEGVVSRRAQQYVIVAIAVVIVLIAMFSSNRQKKPASSPAAAMTPPIHESNDRKVSDYSTELAQEQRQAERNQALPLLPPPSNTTAGAEYHPAMATAQPPYGSVQPVGYQYPPNQNDEWTPVTTDADPLKEKERERVYDSRFSSNIAYAAPLQHQNADASPKSMDDPPLLDSQRDSGAKKPVNVNVNGATGQPFVLFEGTVIETALVNRLDGDFSGPVKVMVTNPVYSHDRQHVLIPEGSNILGEVRAVQGFGQRRLAVVFHRLIMPDGYSVDLDQFHGLNQVGETGLKDEVNNHYVQIFGTSIALGVIAGAAESSASNVGVYANGVDAYKSGVASSLSQSSTRVLDKFLNIMPTLTIREGYRVKVYMTGDLLLPAYENHTVPPNI
jgi:type IV secretion system protein VirB10